MYAVVTTGGKQYRVEAGSELVIERLAAEAGSSVTFDRVLMVGDGDSVTVGTPTVDGASVSATVLGEALGPKLVIFKFKQKATYRRKNGHRQHMTRVRIDEISASGKKSKAEPAEKPAKAEAEPKPAAKAKAKASSDDDKAKTASADEKPKRATRASAAKADAGDTAKTKPAPRKRTTAKKAESEE
jgi:large subunit ribosomal protein L21